MRDYTIENLVCIAPYEQIGFKPAMIDRWLFIYKEETKGSPVREDFTQSWIERASKGMTDNLCQICGRSVTSSGVDPESGMLCVRYIIYPPQSNDSIGLVEFGGLFTLCSEHKFIHTMAKKDPHDVVSGNGLTLMESLESVVEQIREKNRDENRDAKVLSAEEILKWLNNKKSQYESMSWEWGFTWLYRRSLATRLSFMTDKSVKPMESMLAKHIDLNPQYASLGTMRELRALAMARSEEDRRKKSINVA